MLHRGEWTVSNLGQSAGGTMSCGCLSQEDRLQAKQAKLSGDFFQIQHTRTNSTGGTDFATKRSQGAQTAQVSLKISLHCF